MEKNRLEQKDIAIGETFGHKGKTYRCEATSYHKGCMGCAFDIKGKNVCDGLPYGCVASSRRDYTNVIFVEA